MNDTDDRTARTGQTGQTGQTPRRGQTGPERNVHTPHIDASWREAFVLEQRLADVPGDRIGDALATVDAHCAESGEDVHAAFGDPVGYARSLLADGGGPSSSIRPRTAVGLLLGLIGLVAVTRAVNAWVADPAVQVTVGDLVATGLALALTAAVVLRSGPVLAWMVRHQALVLVLPFAVLVALIVPQVLLRDVVAEPSWLAVGAVGLVALTLQVVLTCADLARPDPITDPRDGAPRRSSGGWIFAFIFPLLTVLVLAVDAVIRVLQ